MTEQTRRSTTTPANNPASEDDPVDNPPTNFAHVADACDSTWHNPACGGDPNTWTGTCTVDQGMCTCSHR